MVAVPANRAGDVQGDFGEERQQRGNLVADDFGRVIMPVVHQRDALIAVIGCVGEGKFRAADGVGFHADAEHLAFDAGLDELEVIRLGEDFIDAGAVAVARALAVGGNVLEAVACPDIHRAGLTKLLGEVLADADARLAVVNPEAAGLFVRAGESQRVALGVGEVRRIEIRAQPARFAEIHPLAEVLRFELVAVNPRVFLVEDGVGGVEVDFLRAGAEGENNVDVRHQLFGGTGAAGVIAGGLDAAGQGLIGVGVETANVVALPAVEGNRHGFEARDGSVGIYADGGVFLLGFLIAHGGSSCLF